MMIPTGLANFVAFAVAMSSIVEVYEALFLRIQLHGVENV
jgi:hypothetical protein